MGKVYKHDKFYGDWSWSSSNFWSKIIKGDENECWTWTGSNSPYGPLFGGTKLNKQGKFKQQMTQARRILFAEHYGRALGPREGVYHTCHNKNCMNPHHLSLKLQRRPQDECLRPGPKPKPKPPAEFKFTPNLTNKLVKQAMKEITKLAKTNIKPNTKKIDDLAIPFEAN